MNSRRVLLTWGIVWVPIWLIGGMYIAPKIMPTREVEKTHFTEALNQAFAGNLQKAGKELARGMAAKDNFQNRVGAHSHALNLALLMLILGLMRPFLGLPEKTKGIFAYVLVAGTLIMPMGILVDVVNVAAGTSMMIIGGTLTIISLIVTLVGVIKYVSPESKPT